jgi:HEAT repeat protein
VSLAGVRKAVRRAHRGELDETGALFVEHLDRVAAAVAAAGGTRAQQLAVYLVCAGHRGSLRPVPGSLHLAADVVSLVDALTWRRWEAAEQFVDRVRGCPGALAVLLADLDDLDRPDPRAMDGDRRDRALRDHVRRLRKAIDSPTEAATESDLDSEVAALSGQPPDRRAAAIALGRLGDPRAGAALIGAYLDLEARGVDRRRADVLAVHEAIRRLARDPSALTDPAWVDQLVELARGSNDALRAIAIGGLASTRDPARQPLLVASLHDPHPAVVAAAVDGLDASTADRVFDALVRLLESQGPSTLWVRRAAVAKIAATDRSERGAVLAEALGRLAGGESGTAHEIARALARIEDRTVVAALIAQVAARTPCMDAAVFVLGGLRASAAVGPIGGAMRTFGDRGGYLAVACATALGKIGSPEGVPALVAALGHPSADVRDHALRALARIGGPDASMAAMRASDDGDPIVRERAVRVLARWGGPETIGRLAALCDGPHVRVAVAGLARLADDSVAPTLIRVLTTTTDRRTRHLAGRALVRCGSGVRLTLSGHTDPVVRRAVAWVLSQRGLRADQSQLIDALRDRDEYVRARAARGLGRMGAAEAADALDRSQGDPSPLVRANVVSALAALGRPGPREQFAP